MNLRRVIIGCLFGCLVFARSLHAHPIHRSIAEASYNEATHKLEVALCVYADDFETALSARAKQKVSLDKTAVAEFDRLAHTYVTDTFTVRTADGVTPAFHWVGREIKDAENEFWLYFEVALPAGIEGVRIRHAVMADQFRDQLNSVVVRAGARKVSLVFLPGFKEKPVRFHP